MEENKELIRAEQAETTAVAPVSEKTIGDYLAAFGLAGQLSQPEQQQFIEVAKAFQLNPFKREIYCVPHVNRETGKRTLSIITGYETYLKRAEHTGLLDGWECSVINKDNDMVAVVTIYKKGWSRPFRHEVSFREYNTGKNLWASKPKTMLKKVAIAQAFRLCFPDDMGGMPYTQDELPEEMTQPQVRDVTPEPVPSAPADAPAVQPAQDAPHKASPEQIEEMAKLAKDFKPEELAEIRAKYIGHPEEMIKAMREARIRKFEAGTLRQEDAPAADDGQKFRWASPEQKAALEKLRQEGQKEEPERETVGEKVPQFFFEDDSKELYENERPE